MGMQEPKVLTFDVVGTLIDFEGGVLVICGRTFRKHGQWMTIPS